MIGKRCPWYAEYEVGYDDNGKLLAVKINYYVDVGCSPNNNDLFAFMDCFYNVYKCENWHLVPNTVKTNTATNTWTRSPGTFACINIIEYIVDHVAKSLKLDPLNVRLLNLYQKGEITPNKHSLEHFNVDILIEKLKESSEYTKRCSDIVAFNKQNRWKKRGISLAPLKWVRIKK